MAVVTFTKEEVTRVNPWDGLNETVYDVYDVKIDGVPVKADYSFPVVMTNEEIQAKVIEDLTAKGYQV